MKTHLTNEEVYDLAYDKLGLSNIKVDKEIELAELLDLEWDEEKSAYFNPDCCSCGKVLDKLDIKMGKCKKPRNNCRMSNSLCFKM